MKSNGYRVSFCGNENALNCGMVPLTVMIYNDITVINTFELHILNGQIL